MGKIPARHYRRLFLREWLEATGRDIGGAARAAEVEPSYVSNLAAGRKPNPSAHVLVAISEYLGVTVNDLYRMPPDQATLDEMSVLSPAARSTLTRTRRQ